MEKETGFAFIGTGTVAHLHAKAILAEPAAGFRGVWNRTVSKAEEFVRIYGGKVYADAASLLSDPDVQVVCILTGVETHVSYAKQALEAGKHVIVEKPVSENRDEILSLKKLASDRGLYCIPVHNYIYAPELRRAKRLIIENRLGQIASMWMLYNIFHSEELAKIYGGTLRAIGVHHAYSLLYLLGRPKTISSVVSSIHYKELTCDDQFLITAQMPSGAIGNLWGSFAANDGTQDPWSVHYKVLGTLGGFSYNWNNACFEDAGGPAWGINSYTESFHTFISYFTSECLGKGAAPLSSLDDAIDALRIIEAAEESIRHRRVVTMKW